MISHKYKDNKEFTTKDFMIILSPTVPTVLPIIISLFTDTLKSIYDYFMINEKPSENTTATNYLNNNFIATTNHLEVLDPAFYRIGRFDVSINMKLCDHHQIKTIFNKFVFQQIDNNVLNQIKIDTYSPAEIIFHLVNHIDSTLDSHIIMNKFITTI